MVMFFFLLSPKQFWVAYTPCDSQYLNSVQLTLEQIDLIKRVLKKYNQYLELVTKSEGKFGMRPEERVCVLGWGVSARGNC